MILLRWECCHLPITQPFQILLYETLKMFWTFPVLYLTFFFGGGGGGCPPTQHLWISYLGGCSMYAPKFGIISQVIYLEILADILNIKTFNIQCQFKYKPKTY
jgi:hypothetical protein